MMLQELLANVSDFYVYVITYVDGFPPDDKMTLPDAVRKLISETERALAICKSTTKQHWLRLARAELEVAHGLLDESKRAALEKHLNDALDWHRKAMRGEKPKTHFIVGSDGIADRRPKTENPRPKN